MCTHASGERSVHPTTLMFTAHHGPTSATTSPEKTVTSSATNMEAEAATLNVEVMICAAHDIHTRHHITPRVKKIRYQVDIRTGDQQSKTGVARVSAVAAPKWNHKFTCRISKDHRLFLDLRCLHKLRKTHIVGSSKAIDILSLWPLKDHQIQLYDKRGDECGAISLWYQIPREAQDPGHAMKRYSLDRLRGLGITIDGLECTKVQLMSPVWTNLLFSLGSVVQLVKNTAQMDPKARLAMTAVTLAFEVVINQCLRDEKVESLIDEIAGNYRLILDLKPLETINSCRMTIERLFDATSECAMFVAEYHSMKSFAMRAVSGVFSRTDEVINSFEKMFASLKIEIIMKTSSQAAIHTIRILENVEDIAKDVQDINVALHLPMHETSWDPRNVCLPGSQRTILDEISRWAISRVPQAPIFLLTGPAGCGKTCIANSAAVMFNSGRRLGASVLLDRSIDKNMNQSRFFSSIARGLAAFDDKLKLRISKAVSRQPELGRAVPERQLQGLIIEPLRGLTVVGPILFIIDGLDVCQNRDRVLSVLQNATQLPENLRILITSRPEDDIVNSFKGVRHCYQRHMTNDEEGLVNDVMTYSSQCLKTLQDIRPSIFADSSLEEVLGDFQAKSRGIYLWVSVAIRFLAIVSDDTARAFLSNICSAAEPDDYAIAMILLECSIKDALVATSRVKLKSRLSVGAAMALGVVGLLSDKADKVLDAMVTNRLLIHNDNASRFLSSMWHPSWPDTNVNGMAGEAIERASNASSSMAYVCIDFLCGRLSSDICSRMDQTKIKRDVLDVRLWKQPPEFHRPYINEAYQYATNFWIGHLRNVQDQDNGDTALLKHKMVELSKHFLHLFEFMGKDEQKMTGVLNEFLGMLKKDSKLWDSTTVSHTEAFLAKLQIGGTNELLQLAENCCVCPLHCAWKITSPDVCSLKVSTLVYARTQSPSLQCIMVTPPIMPFTNMDGQVCRTIEEVRLTVDRTTFGEDSLPYTTTNAVGIGLGVIRPHHGYLPDWARRCATAPSLIHSQDAFADQMREPWLWPSSGDISSTSIKWEGELVPGFEHECPLKPGDRLAVVARCDGSSAALNSQDARFSVVIDIEYEHHGPDEVCHHM